MKFIIINNNKNQRERERERERERAIGVWVCVVVRGSVVPETSKFELKESTPVKVIPSKFDKSIFDHF